MGRKAKKSTKIYYIWQVSLVIISLLLASVISPAHADEGKEKKDKNGNKYVKNELIVRLNTSDDKTVKDLLKKYDVKILDSITELSLYRIQLKELINEEELAAVIQKEPGIRYADLNYVQQNAPKGSPFFAYDSVSAPANSPAPPSQNYAANLIQAPQAHQINRGGGIVVAVLDTGIDQRHPAFTGRIVAGYDFVKDDKSPDDVPNGEDDNGNGVIDEAVGHGTHVSGLVLQAAPDAQIMPLRVLNSDGTGNLFHVLKAVYYASNAGAKVINMSLGTLANSASMRDLVDYAWQKNVVIVAAAGNRGSEALADLQYPAAGGKVVAVAATDANDLKADFSNYGSFVSIDAPGVGLYSSFWNGGYSYWSGTSMATPLVSGAVALIISKNSWKLTNDQAISRLKGSAVPIDNLNPAYVGKLGAGRLNLLRAVQN